MNITDVYEPVRGGLAIVENRLKLLAGTESESLNRLLDHVLNQGGKRLRPALTLLVGKSYDCELDLLIPMATAWSCFTRPHWYMTTQ